MLIEEMIPSHQTCISFIFMCFPRCVCAVAVAAGFMEKLHWSYSALWESINLHGQMILRGWIHRFPFYVATSVTFRAVKTLTSWGRHLNVVVKTSVEQQWAWGMVCRFWAGCVCVCVSACSWRGRFIELNVCIFSVSQCEAGISIKAIINSC